MFHVRRFIAQKNLGILRNSSKLNNFKSLSSEKKPFESKWTETNELGDKFKLEQIIRIDHTETEEAKRIRLSEGCIKRLKELSNSNKYLRITVDSGGCSGFEYKFSLDNITDEDKVIEQDNCKVIIDKETVDFIKGSTIDYYEELIRSGFRIINNPNSEQSCSCGTSFSLKL